MSNQEEQLPTVVTITPEEAAEQTLEEFRLRMKGHKRFLLIKLGFYIVEIFILMGIAALINNIWIGLVVGIIGGVLFTYFTNYLFRKLKITDSAGQAATDATKALVSSILAQFSFLPPIVQDNLASVVQSGKEYTENMQLNKLKQYYQFFLNYLDARHAFRVKDYPTAVKFLRKIMRKMDRTKYAELYEDCTHLLAQIPEDAQQTVGKRFGQLRNRSKMPDLSG